jgi:hypothetical protein
MDRAAARCADAGMKLVALVLLFPALAHADDPPMIGEEVIRVDNQYFVDGVNTTSLSSETISYRSVAKGWMIIDGYEVGGDLRFLTAPSFAGGGLAFTDVTLMTLRARTGLGKRIDAAVSIDLLPKQPSTTDELLFQSAGFGVNVQPSLRLPLALHVNGTGGVLLDRAGAWGSVRAGATGRKRIHEIIRFEGSLDALATQLRPDESERTWLVEAGLAGSMLARDPEGWTGGWLGFRYSLPIGHADMIDPQPRMDVEIGAILSFVKHWDVYFKFAVIDRGDADEMATQLPILDGGFDQRQAIFGVTYHTR